MHIPPHGCFTAWIHSPSSEHVGLVLLLLFHVTLFPFTQGGHFSSRDAPQGHWTELTQGQQDSGSVLPSRMALTSGVGLLASSFSVEERTSCKLHGVGARAGRQRKACSRVYKCVHGHTQTR